MKSILKTVLATALVSFSVSAVELESDYKGNLTQRQATILANVVKQHGYRCDSVSAAMESPWSGDYMLMCNNYQYDYTIKDVGGRVVVEVN
jgi:hypothetical protein